MAVRPSRRRPGTRTGCAGGRGRAAAAEKTLSLVGWLARRRRDWRRRRRTGRLYERMEQAKEHQDGEDRVRGGGEEEAST